MKPIQLSSPALKLLAPTCLSALLCTSLFSTQAFSETRKALPKIEESTTVYVSSVFDKLQADWENASRASSSDSGKLPNGVIVFTLNEDGKLQPGASSPDQENALAFIKQNAPFPAFPKALSGSKLEFKVQLAPNSLQMLGYKIVERQSEEPLITYAAPTASQPVSMYYTRILPMTQGRIVDTPHQSKMGQANNHSNSEADTNMENYIATVQEQIRKNWRLAEDYRFNRTVAMLTIDRDGSLLGANLKQSSGDELVDKAALNAIYTAGPFPKAPENIPFLPITIQYIFDPVETQAP